MHKPFKSADLVEMMKELVKMNTKDTKSSAVGFPVVT